MTGVVAYWQGQRLTPVQQAVRDQFDKGGSPLSVLMVLATLAGVIMLVYWLTTRQAQRSAPQRSNDPKSLYRDMLKRLDFTLPQRRLLESIAKDLDLPHPTVMLVSPVLFDAYKDKWQARSGSARSPKSVQGDVDALFKRIRRSLFPYTP